MAKTTTTNDTYFEKFTSYMENNTKGVEIVTYATSGILFAVAYYKIRPFTKFGRPRDIPRLFIKNKLPQRGTVERIEASLDGPYPLLLVNHKPPINLWFASKKTLPVKISGVQIGSNGFSWLTTILAGKEIEFLPLSREGNAAECQVFLLNKDSASVDVAKALLSVGFAQLETPKISEWDTNLLSYYEILAAIEKKAKKQRAGNWQSLLPQPAYPIRLLNSLTDRLYMAIVPSGKRLPELVR